MLPTPETDAEDASRQAERLRQVSAQLRLEPGDEAGRVTISVGVSEFMGMDAGIEDLMKRADTALYDAKRNGRNCVMVSFENLIREGRC
ncbi:MAG: diguanylate cyclase [Desulfobacterales bacterium]|nr:diguanylate cyclase [Desulfobacterales bacterium]